MKQYDLINITECLDWILTNNLSFKRDITGWEQFKHCQAWSHGVVLGNESGEYEVYLLQSYYTIVAAYNKTTGELIKFDWSKYDDHFRATNTQIGRWARSLGYGK